MNWLSYDVEIYNDLPAEGKPDFSKIIPSVAAICTRVDDTEFFYDIPYMTKATALNLVEAMWYFCQRGYTIFGWNILAFDLQLLAAYSGDVERCAKMALESVDGMLLVTFTKGYFLKLDAALKGAGLETKTHSVKLKSGEAITDMSGVKAPEMWRNREIEAVKEYLRGDVIQPLKLAIALEQKRQMNWTSKAGKPMSFSTDMVQVKDLFKIPEPDTSWMANAPKRSQFFEWIPKEILKQYNIEI